MLEYMDIFLHTSSVMAEKKASWTFFSNHAHVYFLLARRTDIVMREIAKEVGITERAVQGIIDDLESGGYIERSKVGRNNTYKVLAGKFLRHHLEAEVSLDELGRFISTAMKA